MKFEYTTKGVCARSIEIEVDDNGRVGEVKFNGGCHGNQQGLSALVKGMDAREVVKRLRGIRCGNKCTSCPDQLAQALEQL